jgi:hypothetical protein
MDLSQKARKFENLHIIFWLVKDSCWMLQLKWFGIAMVIPTIVIAGAIVYLTRRTADIYLNMAILCWICANSYWMYIEFFTDGDYKLLASFPFALGFIFVGVFYYKTLIDKTRKG